MTKVVFRDRNGRPLAGAVVAITSAPAEVVDIGYVTDDEGAVSLTAPEPGGYGFTLTAADGGRLTASAELRSDGEVAVTTRPAG